MDNKITCSARFLQDLASGLLQSDVCGLLNTFVEYLVTQGRFEVVGVNVRVILNSAGEESWSLAASWLKFQVRVTWDNLRLANTAHICTGLLKHCNGSK